MPIVYAILTLAISFAPFARAQGYIESLKVENLTLPAQTASRVPYLDSNKKLVTSSVTSAELGYLSGVTSALQTQLDAKAASGNYITALTGDITASGPGSAAATLKPITNAQIAGNAGIGVTKFEALTASRLPVLNASGFLSASSVTSTEAGYLSGVTSAIQTQLDAKVPKSAYTAKGDVLIGTTANTYTTKAVGADGTFLKADSSQTGGVTWASPSGAGLSVVSKTGAYTATTSDDVILASGAAFTITLYAASGNSGKILRVKKTDSSLTNIITIDGNSSETIDGATTTTLNTRYEEVTIVCDGSNWHVLDRVVPKAAGTYTPTFTGLGTTTSVSFNYMRVRNFIRIWGVWANGTVSGSNVTITLPSGLTADNGEIYIVGWGYRATNTATSVKLLTAFLSSASATVINLSVADTAAAISPMTACTGTSCFASSAGYYIYADVPIAGWN